METRQVLAWLAAVLEESIVCGVSKVHGNHSSFDPSPEQIRAACLEIQSSWTERDRIIRSGGSPEQARWRVPRARTVGLVERTEE